MKKILIMVLLLVIANPTISYATSYDWGAIRTFWYISLIDELLLFVVFPLTLIVFFINKTKKRALWMLIVLLTGLLLKVSTNFLGFNSTPCGFNMFETCTLNPKEVLQELRILKPGSGRINCPPDFTYSKKEKSCLPN